MPSRKPGALLPREHAILACLSEEPVHGFLIAALVEQPTSTTYNALKRLEAMGLVRSRWELPAARRERRRRVYRLTAKGRRAAAP